jgi:hypothetical protein
VDPPPASKVSPPPVSAVKPPVVVAVSPPPVEVPIAPLEEPSAAPAYETDLDEMRVRKRQNWKWTLYEKSSLLKDETPAEEE